MKRLLTPVLLLVLAAHNSPGQSKVGTPSGWKLITGCTVSLSVPPDVEFKDDRSVDTCRRYYRGNNIAVEINVTPFRIGPGQYSNWLEYCVAKTKINTREAEIVSTHMSVTSEGISGLDYITMLLVPQFREGGGNLIIYTWSKTPEDRDQAIKILQSVKFDKN